MASPTSAGEPSQPMARARPISPVCVYVHCTGWLQYLVNDRRETVSAGDAR